MSASIYNGKITDRRCDIFAEGNRPLHKNFAQSDKNAMDLLVNALLNGEARQSPNGGGGVFISVDGYWVEFSYNGEIEIGEGAA